MKRRALYAHYDGDGEIKPYVIHALKALGQVCTSVHFVSTADLSSVQLDKVQPWCSTVSQKANEGLDFGMWKQGLQTLSLDEVDELVLMNSSVFGPLETLEPMFDRMQTRACDAWGVTDNHEIAWHLQSYFLVFRTPVLRSRVFEEFWDQVQPLESKDDIVEQYEVGLSRRLVESGFSLEAFVSNEALFKGQLALHKRRNPTTFHALRCLQAGMPFVKAELLRDNPGNVPLGPVYDWMDQRGFDRSLVAFDREAAKKNLGGRLLSAIRNPGHRN